MDSREAMALSNMDMGGSSVYMFKKMVGDGEADLHDFSNFVRHIMHDPVVQASKNKTTGDTIRSYWFGSREIPSIKLDHGMYVTSEDFNTPGTEVRKKMESYKKYNEMKSFFYYILDQLAKIAVRNKEDNINCNTCRGYVLIGRVYVEMQLIYSDHPTLICYGMRKF